MCFKFVHHNNIFIYNNNNNNNSTNQLVLKYIYDYIITVKAHVNPKILICLVIQIITSSGC